MEKDRTATSSLLPSVETRVRTKIPPMESYLLQAKVKSAN